MILSTLLKKNIANLFNINKHLSIIFKTLLKWNHPKKKWIHILSQSMGLYMDGI